MTEIDSEPWLRPVNTRADTNTLMSLVEEAHIIECCQLTEMRTAWHNTRSHVYRGVDSLFESTEDAEELLNSKRKSGTYFNVSSIPALKILSGDDYIIFAHINTLRPFYRWTMPELWVNRKGTLKLWDVYDAILPKTIPAEKQYLSGWAYGMQDPDLIIGITRTPNGRWDPSFPLEVEMDNYTSNGVRPGTGDSFEGHLRETKPALFDIGDLRLAAMSINNIVANRTES